MSILDKVAAALTPPESQQDRKEARDLAQSLAARGDWLDLVLQHHEALEGAFARVREAQTAETRVAAQRELGALLTGHSIAEEAVLYPAIVKSGDTGQATALYTEQQAAKINMFLLESLDPMSQEYLDKLEHIRGAVVHHMYEEEGTKYPSLKQHTLEADQDMLTTRFREEFERYMTGVKAEGRERFGELPHGLDREGAERAALFGGGDMPQAQGGVSQQRDFAAQAQRSGAIDGGAAYKSANPDPVEQQLAHHSTTERDQAAGRNAPSGDYR